MDDRWTGWQIDGKILERWITRLRNTSVNDGVNFDDGWID